MFKFTGTWHSAQYRAIKGEVELILPVTFGEFETVLTLKYSETSHFRPGETHCFELIGTYGIKDNVEYYILRSVKLDYVQLFTINLSTHDYGQTWVGDYTCLYPVDIGRMNIKCETTCIGCLNNIANQLGHMDPGGCMYQDLPAVDNRRLA